MTDPKVLHGSITQLTTLTSNPPITSLKVEARLSPRLVAAMEKMLWALLSPELREDELGYRPESGWWATVNGTRTAFPSLWEALEVFNATLVEPITPEDFKLICDKFHLPTPEDR